MPAKKSQSPSANETAPPPVARGWSIPVGLASLLVWLTGGLILVATTFILVNLVVDLLYGVLDPRIRSGADA